MNFYLISEELRNGLLQYLGSRPHFEVEAPIHHLRAMPLAQLPNLGEVAEEETQKPE